MWYYVENNKQMGPVDETQIATLVQIGSVKRTTKVWREGMQEWTDAAQTELAGLFVAVPPPVAAGAPPAYRGTAPAYVHDPDSLKTMWLWWAILLGAGYPLCFLIIGFPMIIAAVVLGFILLYRWWDAIQDGNPQTTPGKAVGFSFIPFFNIYWAYVAFVGLSKDINVYCKERGIPAEVNEGLALAYYIVMLTTCIPYVGLITAIGSLVLGIILTKQITDAVVMIIKTRQKQ